MICFFGKAMGLKITTITFEPFKAQKKNLP